jgi:membrane protease YdiL (CAAX protease family)
MAVTWMDGALALTLLLVLPLSQLVLSLRSHEAPPSSRLVRYGRGIGVAGALTAWLAVDWRLAARPLSALGMAWPPPTAGWAGLALAVLILGGLAVAASLPRRPSGRGKPAAGAELLPVTPAETAVFAVFCLAVGVAWEALYRGFLLWFLAPSIGVAGAVAAAAIAYGLAHRSQDWRRVAGSLVAAGLFTTAYALTGSLWWLMLLHAGLPLIAVAGMRRRTPPIETMAAAGAHSSGASGPR